MKLARFAVVALAFCVSACSYVENEMEGVMAPGAPKLDRTGLKQTFADEFNAFSWDEKYYRIGPNSGTWRTTYRNGWTPEDQDNRTLPGNGEMQVYVDRSFPHNGAGLHPFEIIDGGVLRITADRASDAVKRESWDLGYTSGVISTWGSFAQRYGVFEIRAKVPKGKALWPAFWLLNAEGGWPPEIDVFEILGQTTTFMHTGVKGVNRYDGMNTALPGIDLSEDFHVYTVDWGPNNTVLYLDDTEIFRVATPREISKPMYVIANLAVGGNWPGAPDETTVFPAHFDIDWIRVSQRAEYETARR